MLKDLGDLQKHLNNNSSDRRQWHPTPVLFAWKIPWTHQAPLTVEFSKQEYWSGMRFATPGDLSDPVIEPRSLKSAALQADSLPSIFLYMILYIC